MLTDRYLNGATEKRADRYWKKRKEAMERGGDLCGEKKISKGLERAHEPNADTKQIPQTYTLICASVTRRAICIVL